jgi:hypothetical protein
MLDLHHRLARSRAKHNQGFDGPAPVTEVSANLKIDVQRVGFNLCKSGLGAAYWARVSWLDVIHWLRCLSTAFDERGVGAMNIAD